MNKEELLQELSAKLSAGEISREEVTGRLNLAPTAQVSDMESKERHWHFSITKLLYVLGAAIVIIGVIIFIVQIWDDLGSFARILLTLGLGLLTAAIGSTLLKQKPEDNIGAIFHIIGGMLIPGGAMVLLTELGSDVSSLWPVAIAFGVIFAFYLLLNSIHKHAVLTFFAIANGTAFVYLLFEAMFGEAYNLDENVYAYLTMVVGASYLSLAYAFRDTWNDKLIGALHLFGSAGVLAAAFSQILDSVLWQLFYLPIVFGALWMSVYMKSRSILVVSTLALIGYVSYITGEYFADSIGWPISLVILGFVFIGLGYASITINKKYIEGGQEETPANPNPAA